MNYDLWNAHVFVYKLYVTPLTKAHCHWFSLPVRKKERKMIGALAVLMGSLLKALCPSWCSYIYCLSLILCSRKFIVCVPESLTFVFRLIPQFLNVPMFRNVTLKCLTEIAGVSVSQYEEQFVNLFTLTMMQLKQVFTLYYCCWKVQGQADFIFLFFNK